MATVTTPYTLADGNALDPVGYTRNLYDASTAGVGLWSEPNGRLDGSNLGAGFFLQAHHVQPGEAFRFTQEFSTAAQDVFSDGITDGGSTSRFPIAGASCQLEVPFPSVVEWHWSVFVSPWRVAFDDAFLSEWSTLEAGLNAQINGQILPFAFRRLPFSVLMQTDRSAEFGTGGSSPPGAFFCREEHACLHYAMHHVERVAVPGRRQLDVLLSMEAARKRIVLRRDMQGSVSGAGQWLHEVHTRASIGITHCFALARLVPT